jgi:hypothetical protein
MGSIIFMLIAGILALVRQNSYLKNKLKSVNKERNEYDKLYEENILLRIDVEELKSKNSYITNRFFNSMYSNKNGDKENLIIVFSKN